MPPLDFERAGRGPAPRRRRRRRARRRPPRRRTASILIAGVCPRHHDACFNAQSLGRQRGRPCAWLPGGRRDDPARAHLRRQPDDLVVGAAQLEGEDRLQVFAFEKHRNAEALGHPRHRVERATRSRRRRRARTRSSLGNRALARGLAKWARLGSGAHERLVEPARRHRQPGRRDTRLHDSSRCRERAPTMSRRGGPRPSAFRRVASFPPSDSIMRSVDKGGAHAKRLLSQAVQRSSDGAKSVRVANRWPLRGDQPCRGQGLRRFNAGLRRMGTRANAFEILDASSVLLASPAVPRTAVKTTTRGTEPSRARPFEQHRRSRPAGALRELSRPTGGRPVRGTALDLRRRWRSSRGRRGQPRSLIFLASAKAHCARECRPLLRITLP